MKAYKLIALIVFVLCAQQILAQQDIKPSNGNWSKGPSDRFKGDVWVEYFIKDSASDFLSSRVLFEPNARSNWHKHTGKQIIFAIEGEGYYKEQGKPITKLKKGDVVIIEPGTVHSHGSMGKKFMQSVTMNDVNNPNGTTWMSAVIDKDLP